MSTAEHELASGSRTRYYSANDTNAHAALDAYGFDPKADLLESLLDLNLTVARKIDRGEAVTAPGVPPSYGDPTPLITEDCIQP